MVSIYPPEAKAVLLLLTSQEELAEKVISHFEKILGPVEFKTPWHIFNHTPYYEEELGPNLKRCLISFKNIFEPEKLPELKNETRRMENVIARRSTTKQSTREIASAFGLAMTSKRVINIDPGYVDLFKFLLASGKAGGQKVALAKDVYAYTLLRFEKGIWQPFEWTYPDFKESTYHPVLLKIRESLKLSLRA